jgi:hypothetical protein
MHFSMKNTLKNNRNYTSKHAYSIKKKKEKKKPNE